MRHSIISTNTIRDISNALVGKPCIVFDPNMRCAVKTTGLRTYPDVSVYCDKPLKDPEDPTGQTLTNPTVVIEILSPSTEAYDRGMKASHYRQIESLQAHVFVSQDQPRVEAFTRMPDGTWSFQEYAGLDKVLKLKSIEVDLRLSRIYDKIDFAEGADHAIV